MTKKIQKKQKTRVGSYRTFHNDNVFVGPSTVHGRGVYAMRGIAKGEVVEIAPCIRIEQNQMALQHTILRSYVFGNDEECTALLALGYASLYNHASGETQNAEFVVLNDAIVVSATKDIRKGSEIFVNYGWEDDELEDMIGCNGEE